MRVLRLLLLVTIALVAVALRSEQAMAQSDKLTGLWAIRMSGATAQDTVLVALSLSPVSTELRHRWMALVEPSHMGVISDGTRRVGAAPAVDPLDLIVLARITGDSVVIVTHPTLDHGGLELVGVLEGGRIHGRWLVRNRLRPQNGQFEMGQWQVR
jgi:hypothetical protein